MQCGNEPGLYGLSRVWNGGGWGPPPPPFVREGGGTLPRVPAKKSCIGRGVFAGADVPETGGWGEGGRGYPPPLVIAKRGITLPPGFLQPGRGQCVPVHEKGHRGSRGYGRGGFWIRAG